MPPELDDRKRALPEPVSHAMLIQDFPAYRLKVDFLDLVEAQLRSMRKDPAAYTKEEIDSALALLDFMRAWTENHHSAGGIEEVKQKFIEESGSTREAISKAGLIKDMGSGT